MDSLPVKRFDIQLTDIWISSQKELIEMKAKMDVLSDCQKTSDLIISHLSKANETLIDVIDLNVHKSPEFKPVIGIVRHLEETIQREKDNLRQMKTSLNDTNDGHDIQQLIHKWRQCVTTKDQCIQTQNQYEESIQRSIEVNENSLSNNETIGEDFGGVNSDEENGEQMITTEARDRETFVDERSDVLSDHSIGVTLDSSLIHIDDNNDSESEVSAKLTTNTDRRGAGISDRRRQTRVRPAVKILRTNRNPIVRRRGRPKLQSTFIRSADGLYACDWPQCTYSTKLHYMLVSHTNAHNNIKPYACRRPGCQYRTSWLSNISEHRIKHRNSRYKCRASGAHDITPVVDLSLYTIDRTRAKPYACQWPDCWFAAKYHHSLIGHIKTHKKP